MSYQPIPFDTHAAVASEHAPLHVWFQRRTHAQPDSIALTSADSSRTYQELYDEASGLAGRLVTGGVEPGDLVLVIVSLERSVSAILGVLMAGGTYVPVDVAQPDARIRRIVAAAGIRYALTDQPSERIGTWSAGQIVSVSAVADGAAADCLGAFVDVDSRNIAYIIYTSGSTGEPKGVRIPHDNVVGLFSALADHYTLDHTDVWSMCHSPAFDFSVWEIWGALLFGGRLVVVGDEVRRVPDELARLVNDEGVTIFSQTPVGLFNFTQAEGIDELPFADLRLIVAGGERLAPSSLRGWFESRGYLYPVVVNMYGITEITVHATHHPIVESDVLNEVDSPIGRPIRGLAISLRDADGKPVPAGEVGEICLSGDGLAEGYHHDPAATDRSFRLADWGDGEVRRTYFSGDLARCSTTGDLLYEGRADSQVKVRGFRVELGEVVAALRSTSLVVDAFSSTNTGHSIGTHLIAWVIPKNDSCRAGTIRESLAAVLPKEMVPSEIILVDAFPLTPNGKISVELLMAKRSYRGEVVHAFGGDADSEAHAEECVRRIWSAELGMVAPQDGDDFFDLGGDSLMAVRVVSQLRESLRIDLPLRALFEYSSLSGFLGEVLRAATHTRHPDGT